MSIEKDELLITEIFHSLQGETSLTGVPFAFIRLTGCNLRCTYCDSAYAFHGGKKMRISEILNEVKKYGVKHALVTGGEPLLQRHTIELIQALKSSGFEVSVETHGEVSIEKASPHARIVMDVKTPSSKMSRGFWRENLKWLKPSDEVKFVIASQDDYQFAREIVQTGSLPCREVLFSPVMKVKDAPGEYPGVEPRWLAEQILKDQLPVRFQYQLHKILWGLDQRGV